METNLDDSFVCQTSESNLDDTFVSESADDSLYIPTPDRVVRNKLQYISALPLKVCFMDLSQLDKFMR